MTGRLNNLSRSEHEIVSCPEGAGPLANSLKGDLVAICTPFLLDWMQEDSPVLILGTS